MNTDMITYQDIPLQALPDRVTEIDISERGTLVYYWIEGELKALLEEWERPTWTEESWRTGSWTTVLGLPGVEAWGAFDQGRLAGLVVYRPHLTDDMAQLAALFVDRVHRRGGIASRLTAQVVRQARLDGHARLYVSATPSQSAVSFYRAQGFIPTQQAHPDLYALEPEDIHMLKVL